MLITLIVPFFNEASRLPRCIHSIQQQTFSDYEVILIDDFSTDGSYTLAEQLTQGNVHFRLLRNEQKGLYHARNQAIAAACGEYICFLDADDLLLPGYLSDLYADSLYSNADLVVQGITHIRGAQQYDVTVSAPGSYALPQDSQAAFTSFDVSALGNVVGKLFRRQLIIGHSLAFSPQVYMCEDLYFVVSYLSFCQRIILSGTSNYHYILQPQSMSTCYWSFDIERLSYLALQQVWQRLLDRCGCSALLSSYGAFTGSYISRLMFSALTHPACKKLSHKNMAIIDTEFLPGYRQYYCPFTFYTRRLKHAVLSHQYCLYLFLVRLAFLRYRQTVHYC